MHTLRDVRVEDAAMYGRDHLRRLSAVRVQCAVRERVVSQQPRPRVRPQIHALMRGLEYAGAVRVCGLEHEQSARHGQHVGHAEGHVLAEDAPHVSGAVQSTACSESHHIYCTRALGASYMDPS